MALIGEKNHPKRRDKQNTARLAGNMPEINTGFVLFGSYRSKMLGHLHLFDPFVSSSPYHHRAHRPFTEVIFTILSFAALLTLGLGLAMSEAAVVTALFFAFLQADLTRVESKSEFVADVLEISSSLSDIFFDECRNT